MSSKIDIVLVGGGGHCKVVISVLNKLGIYNIVGIADKKEKIGQKVLDVPILYTDEDLDELLSEGVKHALVTVGSIGNPQKRVELFILLKKRGFTLPTIISPDSIVDSYVRVGEGSIIMPGVVINAGTTIGGNCIINTNSSIDHDCIIGDHVHIAPGATLSGNVKIGKASHIGTGASIIQNINIGDETIIGAGSVVVKDIPNKCIAFGVPAKVKRIIGK
jgi:sugar O-acyltransferase (sialic acid O-acetyltransferase NeuD family)